MNTYPFVGELKSGSGGVAIFTSKNIAAKLNSEGENWERSDNYLYSDKWDEEQFKNITTEYLANTYGEVKSKEHAEFIKLLAETNDIPCAVLSIDMNYTMFYVIDGCLFFCVKDIDAVGDYKKITIPLPPESNTNTPEEDFDIQQIAKNNGDNLIFGDADKCKEWPCVGDEVETSDGNGAVKLLPDSKGYYVISVDGEYYQYQIDELQKPKTPAQELRELLSLLWKENNHDFDMFLDVVACHVTKKPQ